MKNVIANNKGEIDGNSWGLILAYILLCSFVLFCAYESRQNDRVAQSIVDGQQLSTDDFSRYKDNSGYIDRRVEELRKEMLAAEKKREEYREYLKSFPQRN